MIQTQQAVQPAQQAIVGTQISDLLNSIMPLVTVMMVFMMVTPMMRGLGDTFK